MKLSRASIGMAVKAARKAAGITASKMAKSSGLSTSLISRTEAGLRALEFSEALALTAALNIGMEELRALAETFEKMGVSEKRGTIGDLERDLISLQKLAVETAIGAKQPTRKK